MEFKVGDRVKVVGVDLEFMDRPYVGKTGTIYRISGYPFPYHVQFNNDEHVFNPECLQKIDTEREFKVGDRVKWTYERYSGTGIIVKRGMSDRFQWHVKRDITGGPLNDVLMLRTSDLALIDSAITEYHGFSVGDVVAVRGSGFTGKIAEFSNANRPGGITVVVMNDRGERRGITTTDIEKALSRKTAGKPRLQVGDKVKVVGKDNQADSQFVGRTGEVTQIDIGFMFPVGIDFDGYGFRRFSEKCVEVVAEKKQEERKFKVGDKVKIKSSYARVNVGTVSMDDGTNCIPYRIVDGNGEFILWCSSDNLEKIEEQEPQEEQKFKVGDRVKIVSDRACHTGEIGIIAEDDGSDRKPLKVERENGTHLWWCEPEWLEKVGEVKPVDDWRARFEAFKASHPVGSNVRIARKVETDKHAMPWVPSMDGYIGETLQVVSYGYNKEGDQYTLSVGKFGGPYWNYPIDALEDVTETNQYTFTVKPSDVDLKRIWRESNPDFAVVVDMNKDSNTVFILHKGWGINDFVIDWGVRKDKVEERINQLKTAYENEKKQRIVVTIY